MRVPAILLSATLALGFAPAPSSLLAADEGASESSPNMSHVANLTWDDTHRANQGRSVDSLGGTDLEFATIDGRDYSFVGTYANGLQVVDITERDEPKLVTTYECRILQGDVQTFQRDFEVADDDGEIETVTRHFVTYTADSGYTHVQSDCYDDAGIRIGPLGQDGDGTLIIEVTDPETPRAIGFADIEGGSHNMTVHPDGIHLYNSNSGSGVGAIEVWSVEDPANPVEVTTLPDVLDESHDITFNADGTRAYSAAVDHTRIINTEDPANPVVISTVVDPAVTLHHQTDPVTIGDRDFIVINDELAGAAGNEICPGGGLHVYDVTGELELAPVKVGAFLIPEVSVREGAGSGLGGLVTCTSHVFRIYEEQELLVIAWFGAGVRVIDLSGLADVPLAYNAGAAGNDLPTGMREIGFFRFLEDADAWSAKVFEFEEDGSAYIYADDQSRGFDVYRFERTAPEAEDGGTWLTPSEAMQRLRDLRATGFEPSLLPYCDLRSRV